MQMLSLFLMCADNICTIYAYNEAGPCLKNTKYQVTYIGNNQNVNKININFFVQFQIVFQILHCSFTLKNHKICQRYGTKMKIHFPWHRLRFSSTQTVIFTIVNRQRMNTLNIFKNSEGQLQAHYLILQGQSRI